jgi:class 3 adenylate cyclase
MQTLLFTVSRRLGDLWSQPLIERFAQGAGSPLYRYAVYLAIAPLAFVATVFLLFALAILGADALTAQSYVHDPLRLSAILLILAVPFPVWLFATNPWRTSRHSAAVNDASEDPIARCKTLLDAHGFRIANATATTLRAVRDSSSHVVLNPRISPLEILVSLSRSGERGTLTARCTVGRVFVKSDSADVVREMSRSVAELDSAGFARVDEFIQDLPFNESGIAGKLSTIFAAGLLLVSGVVGGLFFLLGTRALEVVLNQGTFESMQFQTSLIGRALNTPLADVTDDWVAAEKKGGRGGGASDPLPRLSLSHSNAELVVGLREPGNKVRLIYPPEGSPWRSLLTREVFDDNFVNSSSRYFVRVGDRYLHLTRFIPKPLQERFNGHLVVGALWSLADMEQALRGLFLFNFNGELTFYSAGHPLLDFRYSGGGGGYRRSLVVRTDGPTIPEDVIREVARGIQDDEDENNLWLPLLVGRAGAYGSPVRQEVRQGKPYRVAYNLSEDSGLGSGWSGWRYARPTEDHGYGSLDNLGASAAAMGTALLLVITIGSIWLTTILAKRLSRPVLEIRKALRSIASGDYTVRMDVVRTDELGHLQRLLNSTAAELKKRESIRELLGKYVSRQVADRILDESTEAFAGTRREVTVLFADIRGFTGYAERHDPEQVTKTLNEYFEIMVDVIAVHEGVLDKYIGDGLMAVFGAPVSQPDHATRAVITALEMQAALLTLNLKRAQRGEEPVYIGIGVNSGMVISGNLGSVKRMEFTVIGDTVNLAARLESRAAQGQILIGKATFEKVKDLVDCEALGAMQVKGKAEPVEVWWLKGLTIRASK